MWRWRRATTMHPTVQAELARALERPGCAVCRLTMRSTSRWLAALAYENVNDIELRARLRAARGLCHDHAWRFVVEQRDVLAAAILYEDILRALVRALDATPSRWPAALNPFARPDGAPAWVAETLPRAPCPACLDRDHAERRHLAALAVVMRRDAGDLFRAAERGDGLCRPHHHRLTAAGDPAHPRWRDALQPRLDRPTAPPLGAADPEAAAVALELAFGARELPAAAWGAALPDSTASTLAHGPARDCRLCLETTSAVDGTLRELAERGGPPAICARHCWRLLDLGYPETATAIARPHVDPLSRAAGARGSVAPAAAEPCPVCAGAADLERCWWGAAEHAMMGDAGSLCLVHLRRGVALAPAEAVEAARAALRARFAGLEAELRELIRKHDYRFRHEPRGPEQNAWQRAIAAVVGRPGIGP